MVGLLAHAGGADAVGLWLLPLLLGAAPAIMYLLAVRRLRDSGRHWSFWRTGSALGGLALVVVALSPPVEAAAADIRGHMAQHLLLGMYAPIAVMLGAPLTLLLGRVPGPARRVIGTLLRTRVVHLLSHVATAAALSVGGLFMLYLTPLFALTSRWDLVHHLSHAHFFLAGYLFAWAVAGPDPSPGRPAMGVRVATLIIAGGAHGFLAKLLYARAPASPPETSYAVEELQQAAQWMYYGGHGSDLLLITALFAAWYRRKGRGLSHRAKATTAT